jgi:RHS repeat-associated protein
MNEYTSFAGVPQLHDDNGNLIDDGTNRYQYDFANRLRRVIRKSDNAVIAVYRYDAHSRRSERIVRNTAALKDQVTYLYDEWREIEEQKAGSIQQHVYGIWIDELLTLDRDVNNDGRIDETLFYHQDDKTHTIALTDIKNGIADHITYDAYGIPASKSNKSSYLFSGRRYDPETGFYYYRLRYLNPIIGRFIHRDAVRYWVINLLNGYSYVVNNPIRFLDPTGLQPQRDRDCTSRCLQQWEQSFNEAEAEYNRASTARDQAVQRAWAEYWQAYIEAGNARRTCLNNCISASVTCAENCAGLFIIQVLVSRGRGSVEAGRRARDCNDRCQQEYQNCASECDQRWANATDAAARAREERIRAAEQQLQEARRRYDDALERARRAFDECIEKCPVIDKANRTIPTGDPRFPRKPPQPTSPAGGGKVCPPDSPVFGPPGLPRSGPVSSVPAATARGLPPELVRPY